MLVAAKPAVPYVVGYAGPIVGGSQPADAAFTPAPGLSGQWAYHATAGGDINDDGILDVGVSAALAQTSQSCQTMGTAHLNLSRQTGGSVVWDRVALQPPALNPGNDPSHFSTGLALVSGYRLVIVGDASAAVNGVVDAGQVYIFRLNAQ